MTDLADEFDPFKPLTSANIRKASYTIAGKLIENPKHARAAEDKKQAARVRQAIAKARNKGIKPE